MIGKILLTLSEVADLECKNYDAIRLRIKRGLLAAEKIEISERKGFEYRIDFNNLSDKAKAKYFARLKDTAEQIYIEDVIGKKDKEYSLEDLTEEQRQNAFFWEGVLREYKEFVIGSFKDKTVRTKEFVALFNKNNIRSGKQLSERTLYAKQKLYREYGVAALGDGRLNREKQGRNIDERLWSVFLQWWLDENQPATEYLYTVLNQWAKKNMPDVSVPSSSTFRRALNELPPAIVKCFREGNKAFEDECLPYIVRTYENFTSNEFWSSDYHTLDMMVRDDITGEVYRPHLVVWIDIRSRKILSLRLRRESDSDGVVLSFKDACEAWGLPEVVYLDNGREFLTYAFGGRGKRKTDDIADYGTNILDRVGVRMINAIVKNAKAKVIERIFKQITSEFAKLFITYCGNRPGNRPERHNNVMKDTENIQYASEVLADIKTYIEGWYNMKSSNAEGLHGMSPNECYSSNLIKKRVITKEQAAMLLIRNERKQSVDRNGVYIRVGGNKVWFYDPEFVAMYQTQKVYVRYDPDCLDSVRVYDENEKFITVLNRGAEGGYEGVQDTEAMRKVNSNKKKVKRIVKEFVEKQQEIMEAPELRDVVMDLAKENIERDKVVYKPDIEEAMFGFDEEYKAAVGGNDIIDLGRMIENARKGKEYGNK